MNNQTEEKINEEVAEIAETLHVEMPHGRLPVALKLISIFTLIGGLSIIGSLFVDIGRPSMSIQFGFYMLRLIIGVIAINIAYGLIKRRRSSMWLYGIITIIGLYLNPVTALVPGAVLVYLYSWREHLKPSIADNMLEKFLKRSKKKFSIA